VINLVLSIDYSPLRFEHIGSEAVDYFIVNLAHGDFQQL
jgi:hypothetical protein